MSSLVNGKIIVAVFIGLVIGLLFHFKVTADNYSALYQQSGLARSADSASAEALVARNLESADADYVDEDLDKIITTDMVEDDSDLSTLRSVADITKCKDSDLVSSIKQRGDYWVLYNYVKAEKSFHCYESITYTTQGDYSFLDNLIPLVDRWKGPISVALHAPGDDFHTTVDSIAYLRNCETPLIKKYVTFHIFFESKHTPKQVEKMQTYYENHSYDFDCDIKAPYVNVSRNTMYRIKNNMTYPINVARNVAREMAQTHFIFASDIELYPTRNLIPKFLTMVANNEELMTDGKPKVFVLPIYEILATEEVPENKTELQKMFRKDKAFLFHGKLCPQCHSVPKQVQWMRAQETEGLSVFSQTKRVGKFEKWEAFYIGTNAEPMFDERLSWEGQSNKMTQGFAMCLQDYTYMVLDNAFIIHKPGIKKKKVQMQVHQDVIAVTNSLIRSDIKPQLELMYGKRRGCFVIKNA